MPFKPWLEAKAARHELHDDSSSDEDQHYVSDFDDTADSTADPRPKRQPPTYTVQIETGGAQIDRLVLTTPAMGSLVLSGGPSTTVGSIELKGGLTPTRMPLKRHSALDFYWAEVGVVAPAACYALAAAILDTLTPELVVCLSTVPDDGLDDRRAHVLATTAAGRLEPQLQPPNVLTGAFAAVASLGEIRGRSVAVVLADGDGIPGREYVHDEALAEAASIAGQVLQAPLAVDYDIARKQRSGFASGLYL
ncbi:uncharacterized protein V1510DRAFT_409220 [Dipodascopsis tothii]|uniref:uncharacterized protein n=1 Tax=Dipodascopsis tothii TaxID=44089 RepID=UPI0034CE654C